MRPRSTAGPGAALAMTALLLTGCGSSEEPARAAKETAGDADVAASPTSEHSAASAEESGVSTGEHFPTCDEVKAVLGPEVAGLLTLTETENGITTGIDGPSLTCSWHTPQTAEGGTDLENYGGIGIGVSRDPEYTEDSMATLGWNFADPRVDAAGAWSLKVGGGYDPAAQLDATGVQVVRDGVVVVLTAGGVALQDVPELAGLTNDWAVGAGVAVLELM